MKRLNKLLFVNEAGIEEKLISKIFEVSDVPSGKLLLRLTDGYLPNNFAGVTLPRSLLHFADNIHIFDHFLASDWDCGIAISGRYCLNVDQFPAYFSYVLGHELGHVTTCLLDMDLHVLSCLIQEHIKTASNHEITQWQELPHEKRYDQFGLFVAEKIFGRERIDTEIFRLIKQPEREDKDRLKLMLELPGSKDLTDLWAELVTFSKPYKDKLIESWEKSSQTLGTRTLESYFDNYDALFS